MTKREEIREWLMDTLDVSTDDYYRTLEGGSLDFIVSRILNYLHSQGVVLKVERELPGAPLVMGLCCASAYDDRANEMLMVEDE